MTNELLARTVAQAGANLFFRTGSQPVLAATRLAIGRGLLDCGLEGAGGTAAKSCGGKNAS
jgi:hypothetical protein